MQKVKYKLLDKIIKSTLTRCQLNFLLCLLQKCDARGQIKGVYYLDIYKEIGCGVSTVYVIIKELEKKGFITINKSDSRDMDITILGNDFTDEKGDIVYADYLDLNKQILHDPEFKKLGAVEKKAALYFLKRCPKEEKVWFKTGNLFKILSQLIESNNTKNRKKDKSNIHISARTAKACMKVLKKWFNVGIRVNKKKDMDVVNILKGAIDKPKVQKHKRGKLVNETAHALFFHHRHFVKTVCRRAEIVTSPLNLNDTAELIQQYERIAISVGKDIFNLIKTAILSTCGETLKSIAVHKALKESIKQF